VSFDGADVVVEVHDQSPRQPRLQPFNPRSSAWPGSAAGRRAGYQLELCPARLRQDHPRRHPRGTGDGCSPGMTRNGRCPRCGAALAGDVAAPAWSAPERAAQRLAATRCGPVG
jgi:hypothetical protein